MSRFVSPETHESAVADVARIPRRGSREDRPSPLIVGAPRTSAHEGYELTAKPSHRYVPNSALVLFLLDFVFLGIAQAGLFGGIGGRLDIRSPVQLWLLVFVSLGVHLSFLYAAGCFRRDTLINFATATSRLAVALGFSAVVLLVLMHFVMGQIFPDAIIFRSVSRSATVAFLGMGVSLCAGLYSRVLFFAMARRHWFRRRVLIVGTGGLSQEPPVPLLAGAPEEIANFLIAGRNPTPEGRAARQARTVAAGKEYGKPDSPLTPLNPEWDEAFIDLLVRGRLAEIDGFDINEISRVAGRSTHEIRTWVAAFSALAATGAYAAHKDYYRPINEWIAGYGVVSARSA